MTNDLASKISDGNVVVLRAGEEQELPGEDMFYAPSTITLMQEVDAYIEDRKRGFFHLVDAGGYGEEEIIKKLLRQQGLGDWQINSVLATHNHPDHIGTIGLFRDADVFMPDSSFRVRRPNHFNLIPEGFYNSPGEKLSGTSLTFPETVEIIGTPGHAGWDLSALCQCIDGRIAIVGDLFWSKEDWENDSSYKELCVNPEMQERSREYVREILKPEVVVPGHGPAFAPKY
ncbi:MBL fold metallo-hydrolase [Candidatus Pacearchaeota archaeon]|nr:MBL fold metallo-hydrolase [Candidatus Pacearchaeota archaeon]